LTNSIPATSTAKAALAKNEQAEMDFQLARWKRGFGGGKAISGTYTCERSSTTALV
jgi:hypothetical protein